MIKESYVSFETAKMLKEAGFDVPCESYYSWFKGMPIKGYCNGKVNHNRDKSEDADISRPTQALAARWLREVHHYAVCVWYSAEHEKWFCAYGDLDNMMFDEEYSISDFIYDRYEQALEAGLQLALGLIKTKEE